METVDIRKNVVSKFGQPDFIQKFQEGSIVSELFYYFPLEEEEILETSIVSVGFSFQKNTIPDNCEIIINIQIKKEVEEWIVFGQDIANLLNDKLNGKSSIQLCSIQQGICIPLFQRMPDTVFIDYNFLKQEFLLSGVRLIQIIPLFRDESDVLSSFNTELLRKILNLFKEKWVDPNRENILIIPAAINEIWSIIKSWYKKNNTKQLRALKNGASEQKIKSLEGKLGFKLPKDLLSSISLHDGEMFFHSYQYLSVDMISETYNLMCQFKQDGLFVHSNIKTNNNNAICNSWWNEKWVPFAKDSEGNLICIDMAPEENGLKGQIIYWEKLEGPVLSKYSCYLDWLLSYAEALWNNQFAITSDGFLLE